MNTTPAKFLALAILLPVCASAQIVTTLLNDNFNDNNRTNQSLTSSAQWFQSFNNLSVVEPVPASGNFALKNAPTSGTIRHAVAYFAASDAPVSLSSSGDVLSLTFDLTPTSTTPADALNVLRIGLLDSGTSRQSTDGDNPNLALTGGYGFFVNPAVQRVRVNGRSTDAGPLFASLGSGSGWIGGTTGGLLNDSTPTTTFAMAQGTTYNISIAIERLANGNLDISYSTSNGVTSVSTSYIESTYLNYDFDSIGFAWSNTFGDGLIDNVLVTHTAIPEPSATAALAGVAALAGIALRRHRRA